MFAFNPAPLIDCRALQWGPTGRPLTPPLNLQILANSLTAVLGDNGSGKSTLLKTLAGLQAPLAGTVRTELGRNGAIGYLVQQQAIDRQFPISLQALVSGGFWGRRLSRSLRHERLQQVLEGWQLQGLQQHSLQALSGGQLQRALLARLCLTEANLLLLDEPDASLDESGKALLWRHIEQWLGEGRTVLLVCHDLASISRHVQRAIHIAPEGCRVGPTQQLLSDLPTRRSA